MMPKQLLQVRMLSKQLHCLASISCRRANPVSSNSWKFMYWSFCLHDASAGDTGSYLIPRVSGTAVTTIGEERARWTEEKSALRQEKSAHLRHEQNTQIPMSEDETPGKLLFSFHS